MNVSIAMATYNGDKYIREQLDSILIQLNEMDEIIISDDGSTDNTLNIIQEYMQKYRNIKLYNGPQKGLIKNFENAINYCNNEIIFFSDQDNIWNKNKKELVLKCFENNKDAKVVIHSYTTLINGEICGPFIKYKSGYLFNMVRSTYYGFAMAFRKEFIKKYIPFPKEVIAYDQWVGLCSEKIKGTKYISEPLTVFRRHSEAVSKKLSLYKKTKFRIDTIKCVIKNL